MLNILRKKAQSIVIQALVVLIAVVFIFWGVGSNLNNNRNAVAKVNDEEISFQEYQQSYERAVDTYQRQFGGQIPPGFLEGIGLKQQVLNQLIQTALLRQGATEMGMLISKEEVQQKILDMDVFKVESAFDENRYKEVLGQNRLTPKTFESDIGRDLIESRIVEAVGAFAGLPEQELQSWIEYGEQELKLMFLSFAAPDYADQVEVADKDLVSWFEENKDSYKTEAKVQLKYLFFPYADDLADVTVGEEAVKANYEENKETYHKPEERHARHILLKVEEGAAEAAKAEKKTQAEEVLAKVKEGGDFVALAKEYSEGPTGPNGGDLGFFTRGRMVKEFDEVVFSMEKGTVSGLVETSFGYHIIRLEDVRPESTTSFDEVKDTILANLKEAGVKGVTFKKANAAYEDIIRAGSLQKYSDSSEVVVASTDFFPRSAPPEGVAKDPAFLNTAFELGKGELSSLVETAKGYAILFVDGIEEPAMPELESVRSEVVAGYKAAKSVDLAKQAAEDFLAQVKEKDNMAEKQEVQESDYIKRSGTAANVPDQVRQDAFSLTGKALLPEKVVAVDTTFYVYQILEDRINSDGLVEDKREALSTQLLTQQRNQLVSSWLERLQAEAKVWTNDELLQ